jgi:hypothetical protein
VTLSEDYYKGLGLNLELRAPVTSTVAVLDRTVTVVDPTGRSTLLTLESRDPISPDGRLTSGHEARKGMFLYRLTFEPHISFPEKGAIRLPAFRIDNAETPAHEIKFQRKWYVGFLPLNC